LKTKKNQQGFAFIERVEGFEEKRNPLKKGLSLSQKCPSLPHISLLRGF
jgi:hypothetical protein